MGLIQERWPPVYDAEDLRQAISRLVGHPAVGNRFYASTRSPDGLCQGDILELGCRRPWVNSGGQACADETPTKYWLLVSNTCDMHRELENVRWAQLVPIYHLGQLDSIAKKQLDALQHYQPSRRFFVPPWGAEVEGECLVADFLQPVTAERPLLQRELVRARLGREAWLLLHACLVRFLARDDGRFDPT